MYIDHYCFIFTESESYFVTLASILTNQGLPYDYHSIMHFHSKEYTRQYPLETIVARKQGEENFGLSPLPTETDYLHLILAYCSGKRNT